MKSSTDGYRLITRKIRRRVSRRTPGAKDWTMRYLRIVVAVAKLLDIVFVCRFIMPPNS